MAVSMFTRFGNVRNVMNINNINAIGGALNVKQCLNVISRSCTNSIKETETMFDTGQDRSERKIGKAMRAYLERTKEYNKFMEIEKVKYKLGVRHLANMMGEDPLNFKQKDVDNAIRYLLPSGIYDWRARPMMIEPSKLFESGKEAQFNDSGRPLHFLFYTCKHNYFSVLHEVAKTIMDLNMKEDEDIRNGRKPTPTDKFDPTGTDWLTQSSFESKLMEKLKPEEYEYLIKSLDRLIEHPMSNRRTNFIMEYRYKIKSAVENIKLPVLRYDKGTGRPFIIIKQCKRKTARAVVKVIGNGSGNITINGQDIMYFQDIQSREQVSCISIHTWR